MWIDHVKDVLKDVIKNPPQPGESVPEYIDKKVDLLISYVPEDQRPEKPQADAVPIDESKPTKEE